VHRRKRNRGEVGLCHPLHARATELTVEVHEQRDVDRDREGHFGESWRAERDFVRMRKEEGVKLTGWGNRLQFS
jgi:hypothetical protein